MTRVQQLEHEIRELTPGELVAFRRWFQEYDASEWDRQIEEDALVGKLDELAENALVDHGAGRTREILSTLRHPTSGRAITDNQVFHDI